MKYIFILLFLIGCTKQIIVCVQDNLSTKGIDAWNKNVKYVDETYFGKIDCYFMKISGLGGETLGKHIDCGGYSKIYIQFPLDTVIAHEFGHYLKYGHSKNTNSIMYPFCDYYRNLKTYKEFSNR